MICVPASTCEPWTSTPPTWPSSRWPAGVTSCAAWMPGMAAGAWVTSPVANCRRHRPWPWWRWMGPRRPPTCAAAWPSSDSGSAQPGRASHCSPSPRCSSMPRARRTTGFWPPPERRSSRRSPRRCSSSSPWAPASHRSWCSGSATPPRRRSAAEGCRSTPSAAPTTRPATATGPATTPPPPRRTPRPQPRHPNRPGPSGGGAR